MLNKTLNQSIMRFSFNITVLVAVLVTHLILPTASEEGCEWPDARQSLETMVGMSALVLGGTGAVGHNIVEQLLASEQWSKVVTVGRRQMPLPAEQKGVEKLQQHVVNMDNLQTEAAAAFQGVDAVFCALGTTRSDAGSAEVFKKVDYEYVAAGAAAAKTAGVPYFGLVSAAGANAAVPASDWKLLHPLLYTRTKGLAEEAVKAQGFARAAIFRPGFLDRKEKARFIERMFAPLAGSVDVADVARVMIADAAAFKAGGVSGADTFENGEIKAAAKANTVPQ